MARLSLLLNPTDHFPTIMTLIGPDIRAPGLSKPYTYEPRLPLQLVTGDGGAAPVTPLFP
jgi:hypothetical protein